MMPLRFPPGKVDAMKRLPVPAFLCAILAVSAGFAAAQVAADPNLVYLHVSAFETQYGRPVVGIHEQAFKILENDKLQDIAYFSTKDVPLAVGILVDAQKDIKDRVTATALAALSRKDRPQDQLFVTETGNTPFNDAIYQNLNRVLQLQNSRRVLIVFTDRTGPNSSSFSKVRELVRKQDIQFYSIAFSEFGRSATDGSWEILRELSESSGGYSYFPGMMAQVTDIYMKIASEVRNQYVIGYRPANQAQDGKWRKIKVTAEMIDNKNKVQKFNVRTRSGYYAPVFAGSSSAKN